MTKIGELEPWVRDSQDTSWRDEMIDIGTKVLEKRNYASMFAESPHIPGANPDPTARWVGEVAHVCLSSSIFSTACHSSNAPQLLPTGEIEVRVPDGSIEVVTIDRLTLLRDFADDFSEGAWDDDEFSDDEDEHMHEPPHVHAFSLYPEPEEVKKEEYDANDVPGRTRESASWGERIATEEDEKAAWDHVDATPFHRPPSASAMDVDVVSSHPAYGSSSGQTDSGPSMPPQRQIVQSSIALPDIDPAETPWQSFQILPSAPSNHAFISQPTGQPTRTFTQRLNKEYRVLSSSLPGKHTKVCS